MSNLAAGTFDIWRDHPEHRYPRNTRRHHECGCITVFDTEPWHSIALRRCDEHKKGVDALWA